MQPNPSVPLQATGQDDDGLSALFDGELSDTQSAALIRRLSEDDGLGGRWSEYSVIGEALRGTAYSSDRFRTRLRSALAQEPTLLAPARRPVRSYPALWLSAAATVAAVTWMVLGAAPGDPTAVEFAARPADVNVSPYLAAHQDYAQALTASAEMRFMPVKLAIAETPR